MSASRRQSKGSKSPPAKRALILCGGGATGAAFEVGILAALEAHVADFDAGQFDIYVGTSAGALVASLIAGGVKTARFYESLVHADSFFPLRRKDVYGFDPEMSLVKTASVSKIILKALGKLTFDPIRSLLDIDVADLSRTMPDGLFSLNPYRHFIETFLRKQHLPERFDLIEPCLLIPANNLDTAQREVFGRGHRLDATIAEAVTASSAIPLFFNPVRIGQTDLVDGGSGRVAHIDLAIEAGATQILIINPIVPWNLKARLERKKSLGRIRELTRIRERGLWGVWNQSFRLSTYTRLRLEVESFQARYPDVKMTLISPSIDDETLFVTNPMNTEARSRVASYAYAFATNLLRGPKGEEIRATLG
ncbi:MAG TPA: hypothetical protein DCQ06_03755 [Myxococcales bacterium]|nr:hypothetical protein [Myxococcales bacterium]HAN30691.1 hypothetical protein [Myxococcales bacterium]